MSHPYYNELWLIARNDLAKLLELDRKLQKQTRTPMREQGLNLMLPTYLRYRNLAKRLIVCHDQMVQPQKRDLIKRILDCAVGRMLEYKREIVNLTCSDYQWPDDFMNQLKYTPDDVGIFVSASGKDVVQQRKKYFEEIIENAQQTEETATNERSTVVEDEDPGETQESGARMRRRRVKGATDEGVLPSFLHEPPEVVAAREARLAEEERMRNAILLIQSHERARIGRRSGAEVERICSFNKKVQLGIIVPKKTSKSTYEKAARTIQRAWRRHVARKKLKKRIDRVEELLGMTIPSWKSEETYLKDKANFQKRLEMIPTITPEIGKVAEEERARLWKIRGPGLVEDITDEIREWFIVWYNDVGHFDAYPAARLGGSVLITTGQTLTPQEYLAQKASKDKGGTQQKEKGKGGKADKKKKGHTWIPETKAFSFLDEGNQDFINNWSFRDDLNDPPHKIYRDLIKDKLCHELQLEVREIVDELMRLELKKLNAALKKDYKADKRELDIPKQKGGKKKKGKKKKRDKLRISGEAILKELAKANIIRNYPEISVKDWIGDLSYQNYEAAREWREYNYRLGEIRQAIMEYCVLPLSSKEIHEVAPLIRSVAICGLGTCGKKFLVNAICSEVGALLIDMTPSVLADKYTGRRNEKKLIEMISKVAREYAPAVIFIDGGEKPWWKKVPPEERHLKPKRFARHYTKLVKGIKRGDQILFLTTSSEPYKATRPFVKIHDKFIMIPLTDYNTLYMFYKDLLMKYHGIDRNIDVSIMAKMSVGIPLEFIRTAIENVLNLRRRIQMQFKPITPKEILDAVLKYEKPKPKILKDFAKFEKRTPLGRKRAKLLAIEKEERAKAQKMKKARK